MDRTKLMKFHALTAAFILPIALMFAITGALYSWGIKGSYNKESYEINLDSPLVADLDILFDMAKAELQSRDVSEPEGMPRLKTYGSHFLLEWTGSSKDVILEPGKTNQVAKLTIKYTSWHRHFVQLHKAKGGTAFKVYAVVFAISLGLLLVSGFFMAMQAPKLKKATLVSSLIGFISFIIFILIS